MNTNIILGLYVFTKVEEIKMDEIDLWKLLFTINLYVQNQLHRVRSIEFHISLKVPEALDLYTSYLNSNRSWIKRMGI